MPQTARASASWARASFPALGTQATVLTTSAAHLLDAREAVEQEVAAIDRACSRFRADSELSRVNASAGRSIEVSGLFLEALAVALRAARLTDGDVDPTVGQALKVIGYDRDFVAISDSADEVVRLAVVPGWRCVKADLVRRTVAVPRGVSLDLGATAKALAADRAAARAADRTHGGVLVSLGGDIAVAGAAPEGGWPIAVADRHDAPLDAPDESGETVTITSGGLATSSTTVRRWMRGRMAMHHLVNPATGAPAAEVWRTVSVAAGSCVDANIVTTAAIVRGERALGWLGRLGLPARLVRADGTVVRLAGWPDPLVRPVASGPVPGGPAQ